MNMQMVGACGKPTREEMMTPEVSRNRQPLLAACVGEETKKEDSREPRAGGWGEEESAGSSCSHRRPKGWEL